MGFIFPKLYPHQQDAMMELKSGNILWGGVGSGKTRTAVSYYVMKQFPKDVYVITTAKKRDSLDWEHEASNFGIGKSPDETVGGVLTVDSWNNIKKYENVKDAFFIFDEQRLVGKGAWTKAFYKIAKHNNWILLSATPGDTWMDYIPVFIANGFYKNRTEFLREHVVYSSYTKYPKVERYINTGKLLKHRQDILVHMPYTSHAESVDIEIDVDYHREYYKQISKHRWNVFEIKPVANVSELFFAMRKIVNIDLSRILAVQDILDRHPKLVIFYTFNYELDMLRDLMENMRYPYAEWNGHKHEPIPDGDKWAYLVQYASGSEGWNCTETDAMCFYSLTYSYKMWKQAHGRIDRLDTPYSTLYYYALVSGSPIDKAILKALKEKRSFNESEFEKESGLWKNN